MKFFIDTANLDEIREAMTMGVVDGVTTNPSLCAKENEPFESLIKKICALVDGPVSAEVVSEDAPGMLAEAHELVKIADNVVIKVPMTPEGIKATKALSDEGIQTNVTLVFSPLQALIAAKAGATYCSPFVGRLDDIAHDGMALIEQMVTIYNNYGFDTQVLVASVRSPMHVLDAAMMGADVATIPFSVIKRMMGHPLTDKGLAAFLADWKKSQK
ncbi:MAG: fructose-6-phosphate aldolase [Proteobacteria bacterium]|nr:fructose-6-phosphate aldolase [Pseudomonadota bacterium]